MTSNYKNQFLSNNIWVFIGHSMVYIKGIILLPLLIKTVGVSVYGANALLSSYIGILFAISSLGVGFKYTRFMPSVSREDKEKKQNLFYFQFFWQFIFLFIISTILILTNNLIKNTFFSEDISYSVIWPVSILFSTFLFHQTTNYFRFTHRLKITSIVGGLSPYIYIAFILSGVLFFSKVDLNFLMKSHTASYLLLSIPLFFFILKEIGFRIPTLSFKKLYSHIKMGIPLIFVSVVDFILSGSDRFIIAYFITVKFVGYYNPGYTLGSLVIMLPKMIGVSLPQILALSSDKGDLNEAKNLIEKSIKIFLVLCIPFIVGGALLSHNLLTLLANKEVADMGYLVTPIVACGILFYGLNYILANTVCYLKMKNQLIFYSNIIASILNIVLNIIFISIFKSIIVAAITTFFSYFIAFLFLNYRTKALMKIEYNLINILKMMLASVLMGGYLIIFLRLFSSKLLMITVLIPSSILFYGVLIYSFRVINKREIQYITRFVKDKLKKKEIE